MTGIQPTTVALAGPIMARAIKKSWETDRDEVVDAINHFRNLIYNTYPDTNLFSNVFHCISVSEFWEPCSTVCSTGNKYWGFTLPPDVLGVEMIRDLGRPLILRSSWREATTGLPSNCGGRVDAQEIARQFPTERDLTGVSTLKVSCGNESDAGKHVFVTVLDSTRTERTLDFKLESGGWVHVLDVEVCEIKSVSLPAERKGVITLAQSDGHELSKYAPWEVLPAYKRFRLPATCSTRAVYVQGTKAFLPVCWDNDVVEIGDALVIEHAGRYIFHQNGTTDSKELNTAKYHRTQMNDNLAGLMARNRGNVVQNGTPFRGYTTASKRLPGIR